MQSIISYIILLSLCLNAFSFSLTVKKVSKSNQSRWIYQDNRYLRKKSSHSLRIDSLDDANIESKLPVVEKVSERGNIILFLCFLVTALCALDRVAISVAIIPMSQELGYSESTKGLISSFFSLGYMTGLIPAGLLGTFASPKIVMALGVFLWSLGQILSPVAAFISIPALLICRFGMGVAESVAIPLVQSFVARFVPDPLRALYLSFILAGIQVGDTAAYLVSPEVLDTLRWPGLFYLYGSLGFVWLLLWLPLASDRDIPDSAKALVGGVEVQSDAALKMLAEDSSESASASAATLERVTDDEDSITIPAAVPMQVATYTVRTDATATATTATTNVVPVIFGDGDEGSSKGEGEGGGGGKEWGRGLEAAVAQFKSVPWGAMCGAAPVRAICIAHCVQNFGLYIILSWLPTYFNQRFGLSIQDSSFLSVLPWIAGALCATGSGALASQLVNSGVDKTKVRRLMQSIAFMVPAAALLFLAADASITSAQAELIFIVTCGVQSASAAGFGSSIQDLCKSSTYTSVMYGLTSAPAVLTGSFGVYLTGLLLERYNDWTVVFGITSVVYVFGAVMYSLLYRADKLFD